MSSIHPTRACVRGCIPSEVSAIRAREDPSDDHATISLWFISGTEEGLAKPSEFS
ncbi:uncharacterized protein METZ01_LOCUS122713, partial [marine metagenome]